MKNIIIVGANSYIGNSFKEYVKDKSFNITEIDTMVTSVNDMDFSSADTVINLAGIAHMKKKKNLYPIYRSINRDLAVKVAENCKKYKVKQLIFMSSMSVYGEGKGIGVNSVITKDTPCNPRDIYGITKYQAETMILNLQNYDLNIAIIRAPMIYGKNCKGNFPKLCKLVSIFRLFPNIKNQRSMIYINNLNEFFCLLINSGNGGIYFPQNKEHVCTSQMIKLIAKYTNRKIYFTKLFNLPLRIASKFIKPINKMFGNNVYDFSISNHFDYEYDIIDFETSLQKSI